MTNTRKGNVVLEAELTPEARERLVNTLLRIYRSHTADQLTSLVSRPKPLTLIRDVEESKAGKLIEVLQSQGVPLRFVPAGLEDDTSPTANSPVRSQAPSPAAYEDQTATPASPKGVSPEIPSSSQTSFSSQLPSEAKSEGTEPVAASQTARIKSERTIAGFWRRLGAFLIDIIILAIIGILLGLLFAEPFMKMGSLGRLVGFPIALLYFGFQNSAIFGGQTIGKRLLSIKVVGPNGSPISPLRSTARAMVLALPYFLNGMYFPYTALPETLQWVISLLLALTIFGMGLSIVYLFIFNRRTRQSLHDILLNTFVVLKRAQGVAPQRGIWPAHYAVTVCILVASLAFPYFLTKNVNLEPGINVLYKNLEQTGEYTSVVVADMKRGGGGVYSTSIDVRVWMKEEPDTFRAAAEEIVAKVFSFFPEVETRDYLAVSITRGFDIGIWGVSRTETFHETPMGWREQLKEQIPPTYDL